MKNLKVFASNHRIDREYLEGFEIEIWGMNGLKFTIASNCPKGGDSGHGGRTLFKLEDIGGSDLRVEKISNGIKIILGGDSECETFLEGLKATVRCLEDILLNHKNKYSTPTTI